MMGWVSAMTGAEERVKGQPYAQYYHVKKAKGGVNSTQIIACLEIWQKYPVKKNVAKSLGLCMCVFERERG